MREIPTQPVRTALRDPTVAIRYADIVRLKAYTALVYSVCPSGPIMGDVFLPRWLPLLGSDDAGYDNLVCNSSLIQNAFTADPAPTRYGHAWDDDFVKCLVRLRAVNEDAVSRERQRAQTPPV